MEHYFSAQVLPQLLYNVEERVSQHGDRPAWVHHCESPFEWPLGKSKWYRLDPRAGCHVCNKEVPLFYKNHAKRGFRPELGHSPNLFRELVWRVEDVVYLPPH